MTNPQGIDRLGGDLEGFASALADRYTIERELGRGGHSLVFLAWDIENHRHVAIKILRPELALHVATERFVREIEIAAKLQHPLVLPLFSSGQAAGRAYYVMPHVEGESLDACLKRNGPVSVDEAIRLAGEVAEALQYAHDKGVVHRDIKPGNILLSGGHALVADFGVARALDAAGDSTITSEATIVGSPAYMSPEQASGGHLGPPTDQYALACVLYEMLAGEPPFTGPSVQSVIARHLAEPPPSLRVVRPGVTPALQAVVERALAKVPADRWANVSEFARQLRQGASTASAPRRHRRRLVAVGVTALAAIVATWRIAVGRGSSLDVNKVVVFPLVETGAGAGRQGVGEEASIFLVNALGHTEPLKWEDGWRWLTPEQRRDPGGLTPASYRRVARRQSARWYLEGTLSRHGDFVTVVLRLVDAASNEVVAREDGGGVLSEFAQAGLRTVNELLPRLLAPDRKVDLTALMERHPGAIASWLQGEREYRLLNFEAALPFLERAVAQDSALAVAALRGAQAASWINRMPLASAFAKAAMTHISLLPTRQSQFARGFVAYLSGHPDSAVFWLEAALKEAPQWTEAHMMLGEVFYHLLPSRTGPLDSLAAIEFEIAATDSGFAPPLAHLAEIAIRAGEFEHAAQAVADFQRLVQDPRARRQFGLMLTCARSGRSSVNWTQVTAEDALIALTIAKSLAVAGSFMACAEDGFRSVLATKAAAPFHWGALLGLQGVLTAQGRTSELVALIDSSAKAGLRAASLLYLFDAAAGLPVDSQAAEAVTALNLAANRDSIPPWIVWLVGTWYATRGQIPDADAIRQQLARRAQASGDPAVDRLAAALAARVALLRGDTTTAIPFFQSALKGGRREVLEWSLSEPLAGERLLLAQILLAKGREREAAAVASVFDHPGPIAFLTYLPASLRVRMRAGQALADRDAIDRCRQRLRRLGSDDQAVASRTTVQRGAT